ncbi:hypothetical protein ACFQX7_39935 [Luedemannella flava]
MAPPASDRPTIRPSERWTPPGPSTPALTVSNGPAAAVTPDAVAVRATWSAGTLALMFAATWAPWAAANALSNGPCDAAARPTASTPVAEVNSTTIPMITVCTRRRVTAARAAAHGAHAVPSASLRRRRGSNLS